MNDFVTLAQINERTSNERTKLLQSYGVANDNNKQERPRFDITWFKDIREAQHKEYVIDGSFAVREFSVVVGKPGSGKSAIITDAACHVGAGRKWHGKDVKHGFVIYFAAERKLLTERRMAAFRKYHGISDIALAVVGGKLDMTAGIKDAKDLAADVRKLTLKAGLPCVWIIIDTLSRTFGGGDQNFAKDMGRFVQSVDELGRLTGAHVTVIHHTGWTGERGKGAIDLDGAVDISFLVEKDKNGHLLKCDGANDAEEGPVVGFKLESVTLGVDAKGKVTTAPIVVPIDPASVGKVAMPNAPTGNAIKALAALRAAIGANPDGATKIKREIWRQRYYADELSHGPVKDSTLRMRFERAEKDLLQSQIETDDGWYWPKAG